MTEVELLDKEVAGLRHRCKALERDLAEARKDSARIDILSNYTGEVIPELLNGNDEDDEFPEGFKVGITIKSKVFQAEDVDLRRALDKLADAARALPEARK